MSVESLKQAVTGKPKTALSLFSVNMQSLKKQMEIALPKHMNADRMVRLVLTSFSINPALRKCTFESIAAAVMTASQLGLEIGVNGQGYLIPYKEKATFVPGWKGLVDLVSRSGRASVWTGAVRNGDIFSYSKGTKPHIEHNDENSQSAMPITHSYAVGWVKGSDWPIIEVWSREKVEAHRKQYNKVGSKHYSLTDENNFEMYSRKVALLQVLKYMPQSIELSAAVEISHKSDDGSTYTIDADFMVMESKDKPIRKKPEEERQPEFKDNIELTNTEDTV